MASRHEESIDQAMRQRALLPRIAVRLLFAQRVVDSIRDEGDNEISSITSLISNRGQIGSTVEKFSIYLDISIYMVWV